MDKIWKFHRAAGQGAGRTTKPFALGQRIEIGNDLGPGPCAIKRRMQSSNVNFRPQCQVL